MSAPVDSDGSGEEEEEEDELSVEDESEGECDDWLVLPWRGITVEAQVCGACSSSACRVFHPALPTTSCVI